MALTVISTDKQMVSFPLSCHQIFFTSCFFGVFSKQYPCSLLFFQVLLCASNNESLLLEVMFWKQLNSKDLF